MGNTRNRRTREEMLAHYEAEAARVKAQIEGSYKDDSENSVLKSLKNRLRKTNTELRAARNNLNGIAGKDNKGWSRSPIAEKIELTKQRLKSQIETMDRANVFATKLPFDVERLEALIAAAEAGEDVEFPTDLSRLSKDEDRTDKEHEAMSISKDDVEEVNL